TAGFRAIGGPAVDRLGRVRAVRGTIAIGIVGVVLFIVAEGTPLALLATVLWAVGNCLAGPLAMSAAAEGEGDAVARVALVSTIGFAAGLAGPPVIGLLAQQTSVVSSFWLLAGALGLAFVLAGSMRRAPAEAAP
ncbi:MFS transporter, partial [Mesorhizobium japonicum]|uniref:MFS transporter n=1 Tax=Mesorhizobium japonicum TaxID=2066070 RepID=UPI003B5C2871